MEVLAVERRVWEHSSLVWAGGRKRIEFSSRHEVWGGHLSKAR